jgi:outer membrane protein assembly factor BamD (BamD/ComL family)
VKLRSKFSLISFILFGFLLLFFAGCSRQKDAFVNRTYHRITGRDNFYFNAREKIKEGEKTLAESHVDQYDRLLKIFRYADETKAKAIFPDMDEAIKKASIVIQRHSMVFSGEEKNRWVAESYLLIAKAQFLKHDYWAAIETFQFVASSYSNMELRFDALLGLTQSYLELGKTPDAEYLLDFMKNDKQFPWKQKRGEYYAIAADYDMQKENYEKAAQELKSSISSTKKKQDRIRYTFILAQLYQKTNACDTAYPLYNSVIKRNAPYEMEFNARINRARCFDASAGSKDIKQQLIKMLKDEKNKDYLDQIYYALATIAEKENHESEAIDYLKESVNASLINTNQKALSYLELAEIYFRRPDYRDAQVYYDSTVAFLSLDHPDYYKSLNKKTSLSKLVRNLDIIASEDSIQRLASLSPAEQQAAIDRLIAKEVEEQEAKKREEESLKQKEKEDQENPQNQQLNPNNQGPKSNFTPTGGGWYFYNPSAISFGMNEFLKKWGNRKNEDNWRRSSKEIGIAQNVEETEKVDSTELLASALRDSLMAMSNEKRKEAYLKSIPGSSEQIQQSNDKIIEAYYNAGLIYKEQLDNPKAATQDFEELLKRFPENKYLLATYYNLYRSYLALKDSAKSDYYKNILLDKYPDSEYSKIIMNPNYFKENQKKTAILQVFYENTFRAYQNGQYAAVIERKETADSLFPPNALTPKFEFLKALAVGRTRPVNEFEASLKYVISKYPNDSVSMKAQEILDFMNKPAQPQVKQDTLKAPEPLKNALVAYAYKQDTIQYVMIAFPNGMLNANDLKAKIANFNTQYYNESALDISNAFLGNDKQFILIKPFDDDEAALDYYNAMLESETVFEGIPVSILNRFVITPSNMVLLMSGKDVGNYDDFFKKNYLKTQN